MDSFSKIVFKEHKTGEYNGKQYNHWKLHCINYDKDGNVIGVAIYKSYVDCGTVGQCYRIGFDRYGNINFLLDCKGGEK